MVCLELVMKICILFIPWTLEIFEFSSIKVRLWLMNELVKTLGLLREMNAILCDALMVTSL